MICGFLIFYKKYSEDAQVGWNCKLTAISVLFFFYTNLITSITVEDQAKMSSSSISKA